MNTFLWKNVFNGKYFCFYDENKASCRRKRRDVSCVFDLCLSALLALDHGSYVGRQLPRQINSWNSPATTRDRYRKEENDLAAARMRTFFCNGISLWWHDLSEILLAQNCKTSIAGLRGFSVRYSYEGQPFARCRSGLRARPTYRRSRETSLAAVWSIEYLPGRTPRANLARDSIGHRDRID